MESNNFWQNLPTPFTILAPMDGVTDVVFREIILSIGKPDVFFTEFTNCDGLASHGKDVVMQRLRFLSKEHPIVAQIWGTKPDTYYTSAKLIRELGFDGIDINMGCPSGPVIRNGACSALIKNPKLAAELIQATKEGSNGLPISVKTRLGFKEQQIEEWIGFLLQQDIAALTVHLRTVKELSMVEAHWDKMSHIVNLRNKISAKTLIIGNGDVKSQTDAQEKAKKYKCEGIMIGRGIFSDPWIFNSTIKRENITQKQRFELYLQHIELFEATWGRDKNPAILKKFCKVYINGFSKASEIRERIMETESLEQIKMYVKQVLNMS